MKKSMLIFSCLLGFLIVVLLAAQAGLAQTGGDYDLTWNTLFPGGKTAGGAYTLDTTISQPVAGKVSSGAYELRAGYLSGAKADTLLYLPLVSK